MIFDKINVKDIINKGIEREIELTQKRQEKINKIKESMDNGDLKEIIETPEILSYIDINKYYNKKADEKTEFLLKQQEKFNETYDAMTNNEKENYINKILSCDVDLDLDELSKFTSKLTEDEKEALQQVIDSKKDLYKARANLVKTLLNKEEKTVDITVEDGSEEKEEDKEE
ncbi:hypothetical protein [Methanosphaera sp. WGK6]|uniref:hypothetical protein n=1 Tax=Methanosphaera sp. WGK6 TaxID=1561964 RepID=UPI00084CC4CF|nr:hypothetical protein [Methanosphaera sp. WGK6]OED29900.1 hypothetical protein NL43_05675 [Methanosphaera sp. WGK6]